ncbi:MAG: sigma-70 family RNA polymerase sigma factor, partial [Chitinophagaceae bacterium]
MEESQFLQLIDQHQGIIHKICRLYRDTKEDREDLFQEIVFQLWKSVSTFSGKASFSTWMYRVAL